MFFFDCCTSDFFLWLLHAWGCTKQTWGLDKREKMGALPQGVLKCGKGQSKHVHVYIIVYIYIYGYNVFHRPHPVFSSILYVHVSEMLCCARFPAVVHVSQKLCTCHRSCARFTSPLITFVFNCIHTERILISKSIGATKHVLPRIIYTQLCILCIYIIIYIYILA